MAPRVQICYHANIQVEVGTSDTKSQLSLRSVVTSMGNEWIGKDEDRKEAMVVYLPRL